MQKNKLLFTILGGILAAVIITTIIFAIVIKNNKNNNETNNNTNATTNNITNTTTTSSETNTTSATTSTEKTNTEVNKTNKEETNMSITGKVNAEITVKNYGTIKLELDADTAPITVNNFIKLAKSGFYDGLTFHRIIDGFMIQGGDPLGNGMGGSDETIKGEFSSNGVKNSISHTRGTISMARSQARNSASSQFFIMHKDGTYLDGQYAGFGHVTEGIEIVDKICEDTKVEDTNGTVSKQNQPVIESIKIVN